ncbi:PTS glucose transporter subunit IIA [Cryobacterium zhongshanensis]|uniref:PTS glucose transporter subunit IIA n=1 Tax=Cryobacterium zhongshanensis TaxID=2928153 RepID=A0AA41UM13_9MICO|nr:PTS glucose transporter subunit IIA [Cryobacterium zhongshanensis]MCI4659376.1 PTS glucose transporter subunit IIA [Cryobacterium zhongshanensis]
MEDALSRGKANETGGLQHADGADALIHVGIDTVKLGGTFFSLKVEKGQQVKAGDLLLYRSPA